MALLRIGILAMYWLSLAAAPSAARAQDAGNDASTFYRGRQVDIVVAAEAGTSYDAWARLLARYLPGYIPGEPSFVIKNMPGGGHIIAANYLYTNAAQDGSVIGTFSRNIVTSTILKNAAIKFDVTKFQWLGSTDWPSRICVVRPSADVKSAADLFTMEATIGGAGAGSSISATPRLLASVAGMKFKVVDGYKGAVEIMLAIERGEVDGICQTLTGVENARPGWIAAGKFRVLFNMERTPIRGLNAPTIHDFLKTEDQKRIVAFYNSNLELGRPFLAPPGVPSARVATLRKAFDAALRDPELIKEAQRQNLELSPLDAAELDSRVRDLVGTPQSVIDETIKLLGTTRLE